MERFFIDTYDGRSWIRDVEGWACESVEAACIVAREALLDVVSDEIQYEDAQFKIILRDEKTLVLLRASLTLNITKLPNSTLNLSKQDVETTRNSHLKT